MQHGLLNAPCRPSTHSACTLLAVQAWLEKIGEQIDGKADIEAVNEAAADAASAARDALDAAAAATEDAVRSLDAALRAELQSVAGELRSAQAAALRRLDSAEDGVAKAATCSQVRCAVCYVAVELLGTAASARSRMQQQHRGDTLRRCAVPAVLVVGWWGSFACRRRQLSAACACLCGGTVLMCCLLRTPEGALQLGIGLVRLVRVGRCLKVIRRKGCCWLWRMDQCWCRSRRCSRQSWTRRTGRTCCPQ